MDPNTQQSISEAANVISYAEKTLWLTTQPNLYSRKFFFFWGRECKVIWRTVRTSEIIPATTLSPSNFSAQKAVLCLCLCVYVKDHSFNK